MCPNQLGMRGFRVSPVPEVSGFPQLKRGMGFHGFLIRVDLQSAIQSGSVPNWLEGSVLMHSALVRQRAHGWMQRVRAHGGRAGGWCTYVGTYKGRTILRTR